MAKHKNNHEIRHVEEEQIAIEETAAQDYPVVEEPELVVGIVANCRKLNVREHPDTSASVLNELIALSEVQVVVNEQYDEWYHVITASGVEGYCMKKYIDVR